MTCSLHLVQGQIFWRNLFQCTKGGSSFQMVPVNCLRAVLWLLKLEICVQNQVNCVGFVVDRVAVAQVSLIAVVLPCNY